MSNAGNLNYTARKTMGILLGKGSRCILAWQSKFFFWLQLYLQSTSYSNSPVPHSAGYNSDMGPTWHTADQQVMAMAVAIMWCRLGL